MGAWGSGSFENDAAMDFLAEFEDEAPLSIIDDILELVTADDEEGGGGGDDDEEDEEYIDADDASAAIVVAELLAAALGKPMDDLPDQAAAIAKKIPKAEADKRAAQAVEACERVLDEDFSELAELWAESDDQADWEEAVLDVHARLGGAWGDEDD